MTRRHHLEKCNDMNKCTNYYQPIVEQILKEYNNSNKKKYLDKIFEEIGVDEFDAKRVERHKGYLYHNDLKNKTIKDVIKHLSYFGEDCVLLPGFDYGFKVVSYDFETKEEVLRRIRKQLFEKMNEYERTLQEKLKRKEELLKELEELGV